MELIPMPSSRVSSGSSAHTIASSSTSANTNASGNTNVGSVGTSGSSIATDMAPDIEADTVREQDASELVSIGSGSFARVFDLRFLAFKVVHDAADNENLLREYETLKTLNKKCGRGPQSSIQFRLPMALAHYDPRTDELRRRSRRPANVYETTGPDSYKANFAIFRRRCPGRATYCMEQLRALPYDIASEIRNRCYHERFINQAVPTICRLYFGRERPRGFGGLFFSERNYPLDRTRYATLSAAGVLPRMDIIANTMGHMLGMLHWRGHNDARDVEFVVASQSGSDEPVFWVIDFNQTRRFDPTLFDPAADPPSGTSSDAPTATATATVAQEATMDHTLVRPFFDNDPYYPRPRPANSLYQNFKTGYLDGADPTHRHHAGLFLRRIEWTQRMKDALMERASEDTRDAEGAGDAEATVTSLAEDLSSRI